MLTVTNLIGFGVGGGAADAVVTLIGNTTSANGTNSPKTYTGFGNAPATAFYVVGFGWRTGLSTTVTSVTIGGVTAAVATDGINPASMQDGAVEQRVALYGATVSSGVALDVVLTMSNNNASTGIGMWQLDNLLSTTPTYSNSSTADPASFTTNISAGGVAIVYGHCIASGTVFANVAENFDEASDATKRNMGGSAAFAAAQSGLVITSTLSGAGGQQHNHVIGVWR